MKYRSFLWLLLGLAAGIPAQAQQAPSKKLTLQEAVRQSLDNSKQLKKNQAQVDEAVAALQEAREKKLPGASVSGSYLRLNSANIDIKSTSSGSSTGTPSSSASPSPNQVIYGMLNLSVPVYAGGKIRYGIESAKLLEKAVRLDADNQQEEIIQTAIEAYANLFKANSAVRLMKDNLRQSEERVRELANLEKNGLLARNDLLKAQLQTSSNELAVVDAENNRQMAALVLNLLAGFAPETEIDLDTAGIARKNDERTLEDFLRSANEQRKDLAALEARRKAAETGVKAVRADMLPAIQVTGGYVAADIPHVLSVTNALNLGLGVSYNIGSLWKTKSKIRQAEARVRQISLSESLLDDQVRLQVSRNYLTWMSTRKKIGVNILAVEQATENYRIVKNKFDNQLATLSDLLEADVAKLQQTLAYTLARADAFVAYHKLLQSAGLLNAEFK